MSGSSTPGSWLFVVEKVGEPPPAAVFVGAVPAGTGPVFVGP
jgi:hypothetical protein